MPFTSIITTAAMLCVLSMTKTAVAASKPLPSGAVIVQLFEWRWDDIAHECARLANSGINFVHVSPPTEHAQVPGSPWYERYQPVSYQIGTRSGDEASFRNMATICRDHGVGILVDAVINHMAIIPPEGVQRFGNLGTGYWRYSFPGTYAYWDFNRCDRNPPDGHIWNYNDRYEVQNCNLSGLADLATGSDYVRWRLASYMRGLVDMGVAGFRIDAAKHMPAHDVAAIVRQIERDVHVFQEVIGSPSEPIKPEEYLATGEVSEFAFAARVGWRFRDGNLSGIFSDLAHLNITSDKAIVFIDNHDTQRGHGAGQSALTYKDGTIYALANAFMLAWPYGTPIVMSSYQFDNDQVGPPRASDGSVMRVPAQCGFSDSVPWVCEHRWSLISDMTLFRRQLAGLPAQAVTEGHRDAAFSRGSRGFFAVNLNEPPITRRYPTTLPAGIYCNVLETAGAPVAPPCPDTSIVVGSDGLAEVTLRPFAAVAAIVPTP